MPSTRQVNATLQSLPCIEQDGMVWIWPGSATPTTTLPALLPPANYTIHAQIVLELPVEHGLLMENLLDLAHAPFTHTTTFARGWKVPRWVSYIHDYSRVVN
jgi:chlorophyllide a oxygenase